MRASSPSCLCWRSGPGSRTTPSCRTSSDSEPHRIHRMRPQLSFAPSIDIRLLARYPARVGPERLLWGAAGVLALALLAVWLARPPLTAEIRPDRILATAGQAY